MMDSKQAGFNHSCGNILMSAMIILTIGTVTVLLVSQSLLQSKKAGQNLNPKGFNNREALLATILAQAKSDLQKEFCNNGQTLDPIFTHQNSLFSSTNPKVYSHDQFQIEREIAGGGKNFLVVKPEKITRRDTQGREQEKSVTAFLEKNEDTTTPEAIRKKTFRIHIQAELCSKELKKIKNNDDSEIITECKDTEKFPPQLLPRDKIEYVAFLNTDQFGCERGSEPNPPSPPPKPVNCRVIQGNNGYCGQGEKLMGGGCISGMDGCRSLVVAPGINGYGAQGAYGPQGNLGTTIQICCTEVGGLDLSTYQGARHDGGRRAGGDGRNAYPTCPPGFIALGAGAYTSGGTDFSVTDHGTDGRIVRINTRPGGGSTTQNDHIDATAVCVKAPTDPSAIVRVSGSGSATCPPGTQILAGRWSAFPGFTGRAYPSGQTFYGSGTVTAICIKGDVASPSVSTPPPSSPSVQQPKSKKQQPKGKKKRRR